MHAHLVAAIRWRDGHVEKVALASAGDRLLVFADDHDNRCTFELTDEADADGDLIYQQR